MKGRNDLALVILRNLLGLAILLLVHYVSDRYYFHIRTGFRQVSPYFFLVMLYGWIVVHNKILFERLYLPSKKGAYLLWVLICLAISSINLCLVLVFAFNVTDAWPQIISFWVYTFAGLGVFIVFHHLRKDETSSKETPKVSAASLFNNEYFECTVDGSIRKIPFATILYLESFENYIKVITSEKVYLTRFSMKEAEERLPKPEFVRISRSHIVNTGQSIQIENDLIRINGKELKIGKVYKRYVEEYLTERVRVN